MYHVSCINNKMRKSLVTCYMLHEFTRPYSLVIIVYKKPTKYLLTVHIY